MEFVKLSCEDFVEQLSTKAPVPGGGGASALVGALGTALGAMVANLTIGKKKYADVEEEVKALLEKSLVLQGELLSMVERDAIVFEPLSRAYGLPSETAQEKEAKAKVMEAALRDACSAPMDIMRACCRAIDLHRDYARVGSVMAISDVGVGVTLCRSALLGASLNVFINTKAMQDRAHADAQNAEANKMLDEYTRAADEIYDSVKARLV